MSLRRRGGSLVELLESRRLLASAVLDNTFGNVGVVTNNLGGGYNNAKAVAVQSDGRVLIAGESGNQMAVIRYNADGTLDDGGPNDSTPGDQFGVNGIFRYGQGVASGVRAMALQKDGKIILAADPFTSSNPGAQQYWLLVRLKTNGTMDSSFGDGGAAAMSFSVYNSTLNAIAIQPDGKIVGVGGMNGDWHIGRFTTTGDLDVDFNFGDTTVNLGGTDEATGVAIDNAGNIVVGGGATGNGLNQKTAIVRLFPNGDIDSSFGKNGKAFSSSIQRVDTLNLAVLPDGTIAFAVNVFHTNLWGGETEYYTHEGNHNRTSQALRYKYGGIASTPDGDDVAAATSLGDDGNASYVTVFGPTGFATNYTSGRTAGVAAAVGPDGGLFIAGSSDYSGGRGFLLLKYQGVSPTTFGRISGNVWRDADGDTVQESGEKGAVNVRVYLDTNKDGKWKSDVTGPEPSALTDVNGNYTIVGVEPGTYTLREVVPASSKQELPTTLTYTVTVVGGKAVTKRNFANQPIPAATGDTIITGSVFNDWNANAKRDVSSPVEPDLAGMVVFVDSNKNGKLDSKETRSTTDATGNYKLKLSKGSTYRVAVVIPGGWINTTPAFVDTKVATGKQAIARFALSAIDANDTIGEAAKAAAISIGSTISKSLASAADVNIYKFSVTAGQKVGFDIDAIGGSSLNSYLRLFDSAGKLLKFNDDGAAPGEGASIDSYLSYTFKTAGTYYIAVSDHLNTAYNPKSGAGDTGAGTKGKYTLALN